MKKEISIDQGYLVKDYRLEEKLGSGGSGRVFKAKNIVSNKTFAVKVIPKSIPHEKSLQREIQFLSTLQSRKHITKIQEKPIHQDEHVFLILEYCNGGTLLDYANSILSKDKYICIPKIQEITSGIAEGIKEMHRVNITHRDIKPENILIEDQDNKYIYKIGDLGSGKDTEKELGVAETGTRGYKAPEIILHLPHDQCVDVWSFGVLVYRLLFYAYPFQKENYQEEVLRGICIIPATREVSAEVVDLLRGCLQFVPADRLTFEEICMHPFYTAQSLTINHIREFCIYDQYDKAYFN